MIAAHRTRICSKCNLVITQPYTAPHYAVSGVVRCHET